MTGSLLPYSADFMGRSYEGFRFDAGSGACHALTYSDGRNPGLADAQTSSYAMGLHSFIDEGVKEATLCLMNLLTGREQHRGLLAAAKNRLSLRSGVFAAPLRLRNATVRIDPPDAQHDSKSMLAAVLRATVVLVEIPVARISAWDMVQGSHGFGHLEMDWVTGWDPMPVDYLARMARDYESGRNDKHADDYGFWASVATSLLPVSFLSFDGEFRTDDWLKYEDGEWRLKH